MSYADQRGMLRNALIGAGISPDAASNIANILANSAQDSLASSRTRTDTTPDGLRFVGPDARKHVFHNLDFLPGDPDYRPQRVSNSEQIDPAAPAPNVTEKIAPQQTPAAYRVAGGNLSDASAAGDSVEVNVRSRIAKQPAGGLPMTMLDRQTNTLIGKAMRANAGGDDARLRVDILEGDRDVNWNLQLQNVSRHRVVTGLEFEPGVGLRVQYSYISAWDDRNKEIRFLRMTEQQVLTEVVDDLKGFRTHTAYIPSFPSSKRANGGSSVTRGNDGEDLYFNVFRVGKFTGGWALGATKTVTQVWPQSGKSVEVLNACSPVANTDSEKYVLFAPRTPDKKATAEARGEDENPIPTNTPPHVGVTNYAIEIQAAAECTAFSSLNGLLASDLAGYEASTQQALSHDNGAGGCLKWVGEKVDVVTGVVVDSSGVTFTRKRIHVMKSENLTPVTLGIAPVQAVHTLEFDGEDIVGKRKAFFAFNVADTTDTKIVTQAVTALESLRLGAGGLYADKNDIRVLAKNPIMPDVVATTDCPESGA